MGNNQEKELLPIDFGITKEDLEAHVQAMKILLSNPTKVEIQAMKILNNELLERLKMV